MADLGFATYRHHRRGSPRKLRSGEITPKIGHGGPPVSTPRGTLHSPDVPPHLRNQLDLFDLTQDYGSEASLLPTTPRGIGRRSSPPCAVQPNVAGVEYGMDARGIQERLFIVRSISIVEVLADLKAMEDMVSTLEDVAAPAEGQQGNPLRRKIGESYREWCSGRHFRDVCLCSVDSYHSMRTLVAGEVAKWLDDECQGNRSDAAKMQALRATADLELRRVSFAAAKIRAHYSRLPRDLQTRLKSGGVRSFDHIYDFIASADIES